MTTQTGASSNAVYFERKREESQFTKASGICSQRQTMPLQRNVVWGCITQAKLLDVVNRGLGEYGP